MGGILRMVYHLSTVCNAANLVNSALYPSGVGKSSTSFNLLGVKAGM